MTMYEMKFHRCGLEFVETASVAVNSNSNENGDNQSDKIEILP